MDFGASGLFGSQLLVPSVRASGSYGSVKLGVGKLTAESNFYVSRVRVQSLA
jgi:hypothetical protein